MGFANAKKTGVFLTVEQYKEVVYVMQKRITVNLDTGITIIERKKEQKDAAWALVDRFALAAGLPELPDGYHYGLDSHLEILAAQKVGE